MSQKSKRRDITRETILEVLADNDPPGMTGKALLARLGGNAKSSEKLMKQLRRLERKGILERSGRVYRIANNCPPERSPSRSDTAAGTQGISIWMRIAAPLLLALLVFVAFYPGLSGEFVPFDDPRYVTSNSNIQSLDWQTIRWAFTTFDVSNWHPLTWISLALDYRFYGLEPFGYHLTNLIFHVLNTSLVFLVLCRLTGAFWLSLMAAVLFGLHPMRVESVSWVSERKDVLSAFFWLLTMASYLRYVRLKSVASYVLTAFTFSLGLMCKPVVVTLPAVLLLLDYWPLRRLGWKAVWEKVPLVALSIAGMALTLAAQQGGGALGIDTIPLLDRIGNALVSYLRYLTLTLWPLNLSPWYSHPSLEGPPLSIVQVVSAMVLLAGITLLLLHKRVRESLLPVGWFWFLGTLVPMLGIIQAGRQGMADRYTYIPHIGLMMLIVWGIAELPIWKSSRVRYFGIALFAGIALTLASLTWRQTAVWQSSFSLWRYTAEQSPHSFLAHQALGLTYRRMGRIDEAIIELERASALRPEVAYVHYLLGNLLSAKKLYDIALMHYEEAARLEPDSATNHGKLGLTLLRLGDWQAALGPIEKALAINPRYAEARVSLGRYWLAVGNPRKAKHEFELALRIRPDYQLARRYLEQTNKRLE